MNNKAINRTWINYIDSSILEVYPIQFANCDRLHINDAVYIFDEVGSGKTISSGLMALDYLVNNPKESVCVITTNALSKRGYGSDYGQFLKDWYEKLPFYSLGLTDRIKVINNHFSNIKQIEECGLLIIDDARSLFNFYYFSESGAIRKYSFDKPSVECGKVFINDIWTQGIIFELYGGKRYSDCMVGSIYPFPEMLKNIHICY